MLDLWYVPNNSTRKIFVRLSTGSNFADPQEWGANNLWANHYWVRFSDLNGDGMQDLWYVRAWSGTVTVRLSNGNGFDAPVDWGSGNNWANYIWTGFEDFNGDGKQDFWFVSANATTVLKVRLSTGTSLGPILEWGTGNNWANHLWRGFADFNGDGKQDLWFVPSGSHILHVRLSDGERLADAIEWTDGDNWVGYDNKGFADINGDGKMDLWYQDASNGHVMVRFSTGQGMTEAMTLSNGNYSFVAGDWKGFADFNGDGSADLWAVPGETLNSGTAYQYTTILNRLYWVYSNSQAPGYVTQIDNGIGATTQFRYDTHFSHPLKVQTVISKTVNDGLSPSAQYCYNYENGYYSFEDRAFRGFEHTYKTNPDGAIEKATIEVDDYWFKGRVLTKTLSSDSALLSQITYRWAASGDPSDDWRFIWPDEKRTEFFDGEIVYSQENFTYDPINGNLSSKTIQGREGPTIRTSYSYVNKGDRLWKNTQKTVYEWDSASSSWVTQAATAYGYESGTGNLTDAWNWLAGGINPHLQFQYDSYGNIVEQSDAMGNTTTTTYDSVCHAYAVSKTNPLGHVTKNEFIDYRYGIVTQAKDANGNRTYVTLDEFGRVIQQDYPDGGQILTDYFDSVFPRYTKTRTLISSGNYATSYEFKDGFGRTIQTAVQDATGYLITRTFYDGMGRVESSWGPFHDHTYVNGRLKVSHFRS